MKHRITVTPPSDPARWRSVHISGDRSRALPEAARFDLVPFRPSLWRRLFGKVLG